MLNYATSVQYRYVSRADVSCCGIRAQSAVMVQDSERGGSSLLIVRDGVGVNVICECVGVLSNPTGRGKCT